MTTTQNTPPPRAVAAEPDTLDVTILLPCRNEAATVGICVRAAHTWLTARHLNGEVVVVDNASTDTSAATARTAGARIVTEPRIGYGAALRAGVNAARGRVVIMADADNTYDLANLDAFYDPIAIERSCDMVIGDRFATPLEHAAMNWLHRAGNAGLSGFSRAATGSPIRDFHCGLRSFSRASMDDLPTWSTGMEYATHMLTHAHFKALRVGQTPVGLRAPEAGRRSHLRPMRDGLRHVGAIARAASATVRLRAG